MHVVVCVPRSLLSMRLKIQFTPSGSVRVSTFAIQILSCSDGDAYGKCVDLCIPSAGSSTWRHVRISRPGVTSMFLNLPRDRYRGTTEQIAPFDRLKTRLETTPGVESLALTLVFRQGMLPSAIGLTIGIAASLAVMAVLKTQLVRVSPIDPATLVATAAVLIVSATLGCLLPAHRAMRVDPVVALRHD
jgi:hypothetical protein